MSKIAYNVLQLGAVCVGLWEGNCAKVLLCLVKNYGYESNNCRRKNI